MKIRAALPGEAALLSDLALRSKGHWPYERQLLQAYRDELEVFEADIAAGSIYVGTSENTIVGFYGLSSEPQKQRLYFLFVEPSQMGLGYGKSLWLDAISVARQRGWNSLSFYADSFAVKAFYQYQNCKPIGSLDSLLGPLTEMIFHIEV